MAIYRNCPLTLNLTQTMKQNKYNIPKGSLHFLNWWQSCAKKIVFFICNSKLFFNVPHLTTISGKDDTLILMIGFLKRVTT